MKNPFINGCILAICLCGCVLAVVELNPAFVLDRARIDPPVGCTGCKTAEKPIVTPSQLDVVFIMDSTGSMSPYIENVRTNIRRFVDEIALNSASDVHLGLIEYRDHPPQDHTFVIRTHDFTPSVSVMKSWLDSANAQGGGDKPEAIADALYEATKLSWRPVAVKIGVLISDAPPHGLSPSEDSSFPDGCPKGHDPIELTRELIKIGVTMYTVGCEPPIVPYKDFFMGLAYVTGGQYIPLSDPQRLIDAIIGGAREEMSLKAFSKDVEQEILNAKAAGDPINKDQITQNVFNKLRSAGAMSMQLLRNNIPLDEATSGAKAIAAAKSLAEVRKVFVKGPDSTTLSEPSVPKKSGMSETSLSSFRSKFESAMAAARSGSLRGISGGRRRLPVFDSAAVSHGSASGTITSPDVAMAIVPHADISGSVATGSGAGARSALSETFSAVESPISFDQINRLVNKQAAKFAI